MKRDANLDLIKWLAIFSMVIDHLSYLWPDALDVLFVGGRLAFPLFCLAIAVNISRSRRGELYSDANARYLLWFMAFSLLSELPYRWLCGDRVTLNVMPTLMFGMLITWGIHHRGRDAIIISLAILGVAAGLHQHLMYGVAGVLLPFSLLLVLHRPGAIWVLPGVISIFANHPHYTQWGSFHTLPSAISAFLAPILGLSLLRIKIECRILPVSRWGYFFYPAHMASLAVFRLAL